MITRLAERTGSLLCPPDAGSSVAPHLCTFLRALGFGPEKTLTTGWGGGSSAYIFQHSADSGTPQNWLII